MGRGGEGAVYEIQGAPDLVAKLYTKPIPAGKAAKLAAMAQGATPRLLQVAAWPTGVVHNGKQVAGLLMPRVRAYREIHQLYGPKHRRIEFPTADWGFLVQAGRNLAAAIETIHDHGHVVGDLNQNNLVVSAQATVKLIDCDSFQVAVNGTRFLCEVGVAHFTPPELHGRSFAGVVRTPNHDAFGLAVTLFHLFFLGRHPFSGRYQGQGDMPIERAIVEHRFAYSQQAATRQMLPPPHTLALAHVSFGLASLFERAFAPGAERGGRPTATEWRVAIEAYRQELRRCTASFAHSYHRSLSRCPLCELERGLGSDLFLMVTATGAASAATAFDLDALWRQIQAVPAPPGPGIPAVRPPKVPGQPLPGSVRTTRIAAWLVLAGIGAAVVAGFAIGSPFGWVAIGLFVLWRLLENSGTLKRIRTERRDALDLATRQWDAAVQRLTRELEEVGRRFTAARRTLEDARDEYRKLPATEQAALRDLDRKREATQRQRFLEQFFIEQATISGIGAGLKATLASYGIETAADVDWRIQGMVPGFGPGRTSDLMAWRASVESRFRFDPKKGVDPADQQAVRNAHARRRQELERLLRAGPADLTRLRQQAQRQRELASSHLETLARTLAQAKADASLV